MTGFIIVAMLIVHLFMVWEYRRAKKKAIRHIKEAGHYSIPASSRNHLDKAIKALG